MNFIVDCSKIDWNHLFVTEKRKNIVIDGYFSKLIYSDEYCIMNGIFIHVGFLEYKYEDIEDIASNGTLFPTPLRNSKYYLGFQKEIFYLDNTLAINKKQIEKIIQLEENIMSYYGFFLQNTATDDVRKTPNYGLRTQLMSGMIKIHPSENNSEIVNEIMQFNKHDSIRHFILKISGIWETNQTYGITYKFLFTS